MDAGHTLEPEVRTQCFEYAGTGGDTLQCRGADAVAFALTNGVTLVRLLIGVAE